MSARSESPYLYRARNEKARKLAALLRRSNITADLARMMDAADWTLAAERAGVRQPSTETQALVVEMLEGGRL